MRGIDWRAVLATCITLFVLACGSARAGESYIAADGETARAIAAIVEKRGAAPRVHSIRITDDDITLQAEGDTQSGLAEWRIRQARILLLFETESIGGPVLRPAPRMVADVSAGFFSLEDIDLQRVTAVAKMAVERARLEGGGVVESIEIARRVHPLPAPRYGDIRWSVYVATPRESATIFADADGNFTGADLSNTSRARQANFVTDDDWPKETALEDLLVAIGPGERIREITIYPNSVEVKVDDPRATGQTLGFTWDHAGVKQSSSGSRLLTGTPEAALFSLQDVDFAPLAKIREVATEAWRNPSARINYMMLKRASDYPLGPELRWVVRFQDIGQDAFPFGGGSIELDTQGRIRGKSLPPSRREATNLLEPAATVETLATLDAAFGEGARFAEISINREAVQILSEVPDQPGTMRSYHLNDRGLSASSMMMPWDAEFRPERLFTMKDIAFFLERIGELTEKTAARLHISPDMSVARYTFAIGQLMGPDGNAMVPSPDGRVTLEIRFEDASGFKGGRVTYASTGEEIDVVMP